MPSKISSASLFGFDCHLVEVEVDILNGPASITIVGLGDTSVQEAKERIRSAIKNSGGEYPRRKKTINLAPADLRKHGPMFDLPIALGLLMQSQQIPKNSLDETIVIGELSLNGELRRVPGALAVAMFAVSQGFKKIILPAANAPEASVISSITIIPALDLQSVMAHLRGEQLIEAFENGEIGQTAAEPVAPSGLWHFEDIHGHEYIKRALSIAAAGGHNVLLTGPPGSGKTLLARSFQSILPQLTLQESIEITKIYSLAGKLPPGQSLIKKPPFRAVHHTASPISLVGGGSIPRPGEISLAHRGVLFLDELLEFPRSTLECLRQPLEDGLISVTRVAASVMFPAQFMLLAATNPCVCGFLGDPVHACRCTPSQRDQYGKKLSGPLLDRMDIMCAVPRLPFESMARLKGGETSEQIRRRVTVCRKMQEERYRGLEVSAGSTTGTAAMGNVFLNGRIPAAAARKYCELTPDATKLLQETFARIHASGRAYYRILKTSRTIADLEQSEKIAPHHLAEALQYRPKFGMEWAAGVEN